MNASRGRRPTLLIALVLSTVLIQLVVAVILKELADARAQQALGWLVFFLGVALGLNGLRFLIWGYTHKHYPLSHSYPLTALFFPCVVALSAWYGDVITWAQIAGVVLIVGGIALMNWGPGGNEV